MSMIVAIHQPEFLPWLGFFHKMRCADRFVLLDHVQFMKNGRQNRTEIRGAAGPQWLTVPVLHRLGQSILEVCINRTERWTHRHLQTLRSCYGRAPHFAAVAPALEEIYAREWTHLADLNVALLEAVVRLLDIRTPVLHSSALAVQGHRSELVLEICRRLGARTYLSGVRGAAYLDREAFAAAGITVEVQRFTHPVYPQRHGEFVANLSVVDLLFNVGPEAPAYLEAA